MNISLNNNYNNPSLSSSSSSSSSSTTSPTISTVSSSPKSSVTTQKNLESIVFVDTIEKLLLVLPELRRHTVWAIDLEGVDLGATGEICIIQISTGRYSPVILLDVHTLGKNIFTTEYCDCTSGNTSSTVTPLSSSSTTTISSTTNNSNKSGSSGNTTTARSIIPAAAATEVYSLQQLLEDTTIIKFMWDVRSDTNALYGLFGVTIKSAVDLQVSRIL